MKPIPFPQLLDTYTMGLRQSPQGIALLDDMGRGILRRAPKRCACIWIGDQQHFSDLQCSIVCGGIGAGQQFDREVALAGK